MKTDHWKNYEPIERTLQFDERGAGPIVDVVQVTANTHPSDAYPEQRIQVRTGTLACAGLTVEQSATLRAQLERAERDVRTAMRQPALAATGAEGRCESCSQPVRAGEPIVIDDADTEDRVVLHAGPCPAERSN